MNSEILKKMAQEILTQDNRCTAHPMYQVWDWNNNPESSLKQVFFTNEAAEEFTEENRHNMSKPYIYISSGYNNKEWVAIREFLKGIAK